MEGVTKAKGADKRRSRRGQRGVRKMFDKKTGRLIPRCFLFRWNYYLKKKYHFHAHGNEVLAVILDDFIVFGLI